MQKAKRKESAKGRVRVSKYKRDCENVHSLCTVWYAWVFQNVKERHVNKLLFVRHTRSGTKEYNGTRHATAFA
jgi:hypothetical protein